MGMTTFHIALLFGAIIFAVSSGLLLFSAAAGAGHKGLLLLRRTAEARNPWGRRPSKLDLELHPDPKPDPRDGSEFYRWAGVKRLIDCTASITLLSFLAPLLIVTAIAIKLDSPGPVLYRQRRIGFRGKNFEVFKFRSMMVDAEKDGPQYASANDSRITWVGRFIRKTRIDEIPQTINVLRGEMSFVGPRPERPEFVGELEKAIPQYHNRHIVKPGITGWAQVKYEYAASVEGAREKLRYDLFYIRHFTPLFDIVIILMTIRVAVFGIGSR
jgi:exopolysaccharide biosynthesis polyprenyl glycosylphosphotransferase